MRRSCSRPTLAAALAAALATALAVTGCTADDDEASADTTAATTAAPTTAAPASTDPTTEVAASRYQATIQRTTGNVPHITAPDLTGVVFGQGWANAEDHACTLADQVLRVKGERAKWLGAGPNNANVDSDFAWRAIGVHDLALADWPDQPGEVRDELTAYAAGWNAYLEDVGVDGLHGWCKGQPWVQPITPEDLYTYARSVTLLASSSRLTPYLGKAQPPSADTSPSTSEDALGPLGLAPAATASNGWAIGEERATGGGALLLANPHFPWEGELRFWEVHLRVPGETDIYGVQLIGLPGVGIGFNEGVAWTHTVSAGRRFTVYDLDLMPGDPTSYLVDGQPKKLLSREVTVEVAGGAPETRKLWASEYGPVLDFPGIGWNAERVATYRDANLDNDEFAAQYLAMDRATDLDELIAVHEEYQGVPLFNTLAVGADGRAWYADTSATPNLSADTVAAWEQAKASDPIVKLADEQGVTVLDGSTSATAWVDEPGARDPGLVPYAKQPKVERTDYLFNANDSFWIPNAQHPLEGDYSPLHGLQRTARSPRTRQNAAVLSDTSAAGASGADGTFDLAELQSAALANGGYTATALRDGVVARCTAQPLVEVPELTGSDGSVALPADTVDVSGACALLGRWDGTFNLDSVGAALWHELMGRYATADFVTVGALWAEAFDPAQPVDTPRGLAAPPAGQPDPVLVNLARVVQTLPKAGIPLDAAWGEVQYADRNGTRVPIHGGSNKDGVTNIVGYNPSSTSAEPLPEVSPVLVPGSTLRSSGYPVNNGTSFLLSVHLTDDGPKAAAFLTYSNTGDRSNPEFVRATERFSEGEWRDIVFTDDEIAADPELRTYDVSGD